MAGKSSRLEPNACANLWTPFSWSAAERAIFAALVWARQQYHNLKVLLLLGARTHAQDDAALCQCHGKRLGGHNKLLGDRGVHSTDDVHSHTRMHKHTHTHLLCSN